MTFLEKIGDRIKELRNAKQLSQEDLSAMADISRTYLSGVENGKKNIAAENIEKIIDALEISAEEFFKHKNFRKK